MKRRKFLVHTVIGTAAIGLSPILSFASKESVTHQSLPGCSAHIRHGILSPEIASFTKVDDLLNVYGKQLFFRNGFEKSDKDLVNFSFELNKEFFCLSWIGSKVYLNSREFETKPSEKLKILERSGRRISVLQDKMVRINTNTGTRKQIVLIQGEFEMHGKVIENDAIYEMSKGMEIRSAKNGKILIIENLNYE